VKPPTKLNSLFFEPDPHIIEEEKLSLITKKDDLVLETEKLEKELEEIEERKQNGWDVSESFDFLQRKFQILENVKKKIAKLENDKRKEERAKLERKKHNKVVVHGYNDYSRLDQEKNDQTLRERTLPQTDKPDNIFKHLNEKIDNKFVNLYLIFHCCVFEKEKRIEDYKNEILSFLKTNQNAKIAFSVFYSDWIEKTPDKKFHDFKSFSKATLVKAKIKNELKSIRDEVIDINSDEKALSILCNIATLSCKHLKKDIEHFIQGIRDPVQDLLEYKKIMCLNFLIGPKNKYEEFGIKLENVTQFFDESNLNMIYTNKKDSFFAEALFNLKRSKIKSVVEFKEFMRNLSNNYNNQKLSFKNQFFFMKSMKILELNEIFDNHFHSNNKIEEDSYIICLKREISISSNDHAYIAYIHNYTSRFCFKPDLYFLNAFDSFLCQKFLEIHETAKFFVTQFNKYMCHELLLISVAKIFFNDSQHLFGITNYIGRSLEHAQDAKIKIKLRHPIIDAFVHFCFLFSKQTTVVVDLRTVKLGDQLLLTEPIIFSSFDKYGSSNLGIDGINYLTNRHKCNSLCEKFVLLLK
jgi:hypothetical protein